MFCLYNKQGEEADKDKTGALVLAEQCRAMPCPDPHQQRLGRLLAPRPKHTQKLSGPSSEKLYFSAVGWHTFPTPDGVIKRKDHVRKPEQEDGAYLKSITHGSAGVRYFSRNPGGSAPCYGLHV